MSGAEGVGPGDRQPGDLAGPAAQEPSGSHRLLHLLGALLVGVVLPAVLVGALVGELGVSALFTGVVWGAVGAKLAGTRRMVYVTPLVGVVAGLGAYTAYDWWWVALLAATGVLAGVGFRFGWFAPLLMVPYAATFVTPVDTASSAVTFGAIVAIGTAYGLVIMRRFGAPPVVEGDRYSLPVTAVIALCFGAVLGGAAALGVALSWTEPYWVPEPILVLVMYLLHHREQERDYGKRGLSPRGQADDGYDHGGDRAGSRAERLLAYPLAVSHDQGPGERCGQGGDLRGQGVGDQVRLVSVG